MDQDNQRGIYLTKLMFYPYSIGIFNKLLPNDLWLTKLNKPY